MRLCLLAVLLSGCLFGKDDPVAVVTITSPESGVVVADHGPMLITAEISNAPIQQVKLSVDGKFDDTVVVNPSPRGKDCTGSCTFELMWDSASADEGPQVVSVLAFGEDDSDAIGFADLALTFDDAPEVASLSPMDGEDLVGIGMLDIKLQVIERGATTIKLEIDGELVDTKERPTCKTGCALSWPWDTKPLVAGTHELKFTLSDSKGHVVERISPVRVHDLVTITAMQLTNTVDDSGTLEIEVYVFDSVTNKLLGCVGTAGGMGPVDASDVRYNLNATLIDLNGETLGSLDLAAHPIRFEVWEDDDAPVCPTVFNPGGNDMVGVSAAKTIAQWKATPMSTFGNVTELRAVFDRPLSR